MTREELKRLRRAAGLSQGQLASLLGLAPQTIQRWEQREDEISAAMSLLVSLALDGTGDDRPAHRLNLASGMSKARPGSPRPARPVRPGAKPKAHARSHRRPRTPKK